MGTNRTLLSVRGERSLAGARGHDQRNKERFMRKGFWETSFLSVLMLLVFLPAALLAQRPRNRPAAPAAANDLKITYRTTTSGQAMETTTMLKGALERSEMKLGHGMDIINITQCDLKR